MTHFWFVCLNSSETEHKGEILETFAGVCSVDANLCAMYPNSFYKLEAKDLLFVYLRVTQIWPKEQLSKLHGL